MDYKQMNVYQKLLQIKKVARQFKKSAKGHGFNYVPTDQIIDKILDTEIEVGITQIFLGSESKNISAYDYTSKEGNRHHDFVLSGSATFAWVNTDKPEDRIVVVMEYYGQQEDISQAYGSGLTYMERYFLTKTLGIPTNENDPDKNNNKNTTTEKQLSKYDQILQMLRKSQYTLQDVNIIIKAKFGSVIRLNDLTDEQFATVQNEIVEQLLNNA